MILVTTGTNEQPFDRLVRAARDLSYREDAFVQYGSSREAHGDGEWVDFLGFDELAERIREARVVVCHAGVGSIMLARRCGHRPVVVPRRGSLGEAVDDHQLELGRRMHAAGLVTLVEDERDLPAVTGVPADAKTVFVGQQLAGGAALAADLRTYITRFMPVMPAKEG